MENQPRTLSVHIPVTLLSLAIAVFLASQIAAASRQTETGKWQLGTLDKNMSELKAAEKQLDDISTQAKPMLETAKKVQEMWTNLFKDVLELSKTDNDAKAVIEKWKIQSGDSAPAAASGTPAPAPAATPAPGGAPK